MTDRERELADKGIEYAEGMTMKPVQIKILNNDDTEPAWKFPEGTEFISDEVQKVAILQGGMVSGRHSLAIIHELPDGSVLMLEMSMIQLEMIFGAATGAKMRWDGQKS